MTSSSHGSSIRISCRNQVFPLAKSKFWTAGKLTFNHMTEYVKQSLNGSTQIITFTQQLICKYYTGATYLLTTPCIHPSVCPDDWVIECGHLRTPGADRKKLPKNVSIIFISVGGGGGGRGGGGRYASSSLVGHLQVTFCSPFFWPFKNGLNVVLWRCSHMTLKEDQRCWS